MLRIERQVSLTGYPGIEQKGTIYVLEQRSAQGGEWVEVERIMFPVQCPVDESFFGVGKLGHSFQVRKVRVYGLRENPRVRKLAERILDCNDMSEVRKVFAEYSELETDPFGKE